MRNELEVLSAKLRALHQDLLLLQVQNVEQVDERKYTSYDALQLAIYDSRFEWLRRISTLVTHIDVLIYETDDVAFDGLKAIYQEASALFQKSETDFSDHYKIALNLDPHLFVKQGEVLMALLGIKEILS